MADGTSISAQASESETQSESSETDWTSEATVDLSLLRAAGLAIGLTPEGDLSLSGQGFRATWFATLLTAAVEGQSKVLLDLLLRRQSIQKELLVGRPDGWKPLT